MKNFQANIKKRIPIKALAVFCFCIVYFIFSLFYYPFSNWLNSLTNDFFICSFIKNFEIPCPACGASRAAFFYVSGCWGDSVKHHSGIFILSFLLSFRLIQSIYCIWKKKVISIHYYLNLLILTGIFIISMIQWCFKILR